jgi:hypothetical protein
MSKPSPSGTDRLRDGSAPSAVTAELVLYDAAETEMLSRATSALASAGVAAIVFKGAAVARLVYPGSWQRRRADADMLLQPDDWRRADAVLRHAVGERLQPAIDPDAMGQWQYRDMRTGLLLDVHVQLFEPAPLATAVRFDELAASSVRVPGLDAVRAPGLVHALWIALVHPVAHHDAVLDPVWQEDARRLAAALSDQRWRDFVGLCERTQTATICLAGLAAAGVSLADTHSIRLSREGEPSRHLLRAGRRSALGRQFMFLRALPDWPSRARELRRRLFPPAAYMRERYGRPVSAPVLPLYLRRLAEGLAGPWRARAAPAEDRFTSKTE